MLYYFKDLIRKYPTAANKGIIDSIIHSSVYSLNSAKLVVMLYIISYKSYVAVIANDSYFPKLQIWKNVQKLMNVL